MPMPSYPIYCQSKGCKNLAVYKIAGRWSDGLQSELKTYALSCADCLRDWYTKGLVKQKACRPAPAETLEPPGIYHMERGRRDQNLQRLEELEKELVEYHI
jgi:hypothetical protein